MFFFFCLHPFDIFVLYDCIFYFHAKQDKFAVVKISVAHINIAQWSTSSMCFGQIICSQFKFFNTHIWYFLLRAHTHTHIHNFPFSQWSDTHFDCDTAYAKRNNRKKRRSIYHFTALSATRCKKVAFHKHICYLFVCMIWNCCSALQLIKMKRKNYENTECIMGRIFFLFI